MSNSISDADINSVNKSETSEQPEELSTVTVPLVSGLNCIICGKDQPAYKCPSCYAKYCSVNCCTSHKSDPDKCEALKPKKEEKNTQITTGAARDYYYPTKDTVPIQKLEMLSQGDNLVQLKKFFGDPTIKSNILKLDTCSDPISEFVEVMENDNFVRFSAFITNELMKEPTNFPRE